MKIGRSSICSLKEATASKKKQIDMILNEYQKVCQHYIDLFWEMEKTPENKDLLKPIIDTCGHWFSYRLRKLAAREARGLVQAVKSNKGNKPKHSGKSASLGETIVDIQRTEGKTFDAWLRLTCIGNKIKLFIPVNFHKHFNELDSIGQLKKSVILKRDSVQFYFEIETGLKQEPNKCIGVDTGINALATLSTGEQAGLDVKNLIAISKRKKWGSKGHKKAQRTIKQRINEVARDVAGSGATLIVTERLIGITKNTKRRLGKEMRRSVGVWNVRHWLMRLEQQCERNRVSFRTVSPYYTSQTCSKCGHIDRRNRIGEDFACRSCGHTDNADVQASRNILSRFLSGPYGAGCKPYSELLFT